MQVPIKNLQNDLVAQLVEHSTFNAGVVGSSPTGVTIKLPSGAMVARRTLNPKVVGSTPASATNYQDTT